MVDMNSVDMITQASPADLQNDNNLLDREELEALNDQIKNQYVDFNNLGQNLLKDVEYKLKVPIFRELLDYVNNNYTAIINFDEAMISTNKTIEVGNYVYQFVAADCYNSLLPNYLELVDIISIDQFDLYLKNTLHNDASNFKTNFIKVIQSIINQLNNLKQLDKNIVTDENYQELLKRHAFYIELINFGDTNDFLFNYIHPLLIKNFGDIVWRMS